MPKRPVSYLNPVHGAFAQYHGAQAGFYRNASRAARRNAESAAHAAGVRQIGRIELALAERNGTLGALCSAAAAE